MNSLEEQIVEALVELGDCPLAIANRLKEKGVVGRLNHCIKCPIATFLANHPLCIGMDVDVDEKAIHVGHMAITYHAYPKLLPIRAFIMKFDNEEYPELIKRSGDYFG